LLFLIVHHNLAMTGSQGCTLPAPLLYHIRFYLTSTSYLLLISTQCSTSRCKYYHSDPL